LTLRFYLRRSRADEGHQQFSLDVQRRGCLHLAQEMQIDSEPIEYVDDGRAGDDFAGRAGLGRLMKETQRGDVVVARDQSRIGRDALEVTYAIRTLTK
jgi:DNA invertase Pin-like site-specific DNA recombinase